MKNKIVLVYLAHPFSDNMKMNIARVNEIAEKIIEYSIEREDNYFWAPIVPHNILSIYQENINKNIGHISNDQPFEVTYMGIGEPLVNLDEVYNSILILSKKYSKIEKFNISTIGPENGIDNLIYLKDLEKIHLQLSLHSPFDDERRSLFRKELPSIEQTLNRVTCFARAKNDVPCSSNFLLISLAIRTTSNVCISLVRILGCHSGNN